MRLLTVVQYFWPANLRVNDLALGLLERAEFVPQVAVLECVSSF